MFREVGLRRVYEIDRISSDDRACGRPHELDGLRHKSVHDSHGNAERDLVVEFAQAVVRRRGNYIPLGVMWRCDALRNVRRRSCPAGHIAILDVAPNMTHG